MVTRGLVPRQGSRLISMETAEAMKTCTSKSKVFVGLIFFLAAMTGLCVPGCVWLRGGRGDVKVLKGRVLGGGP